ncbi:MAG TPA: hypothetical protein VK539_03145 [Myxococcaceae bacterium]|nr:hypothetical protein [Myxococcaceae bacterium]
MSATCNACGQWLPTKSDTFKFRLPLYGESFGIVGVTQHGKSTWAKQWAAFLLTKLYSVIAWDPGDEWSVMGKARKYAKRGPLKVKVLFSELLSKPVKYLSRKRLSLAVVPDEMPAELLNGEKKISQDEWISSQFRRFAAWVRRATPEGVPIALFIDECHQLLKHAEDVLEDVALRWAKEEIVPVFIAQRWLHFPKNVRAQLAWVVSFLQTEKSDLRFMREDVGRDFARAVVGLTVPGRFRVANRRRPHPDALASL